MEAVPAGTLPPRYGPAESALQPALDRIQNNVRAPPAFLPDSTWTVRAADLICTLSQHSTDRSVTLVRTITVSSLVYPVADWEAGRDARRRILR